MDERDDLVRARDRARALDSHDDERAGDDDASAVKAPGDVLGVSHVRPTGRRDAERDARDLDEETGDGGAGGPRERSKVGTRDVSEGTTGGTGPDTGGAGVLRKGSGATGTDIGK